MDGWEWLWNLLYEQKKEPDDYYKQERAREKYYEEKYEKKQKQNKL